jgi:hypothetical protein
VYVGRRMTMGGWNLPTSVWANPFAIVPVEQRMSTGTKARYDALTRAQRTWVKTTYLRDERARVLAVYEEYVRGSPKLLSRLRELTGATLGCWCLGKVKRPSPDTLICHGEVLAKLWDEFVG